MVLYACAVFLAAFLLFQIQPLIAKIILPWFGGASSVWNTCMLFFQAALLLGYLYAHWLNERLNARRQAAVHSAVLLVSLALLPVMPKESWKAASAAHPEGRILLLLAATVGLPFFLLSTTSPLLQAWYARTHAGKTPYRLFALSNFASLAALLSYPVLVEPYFSVRAQAWMWSGAYAFFVLLAAAVAWRSASGHAMKSAPPMPPAAPPGWQVRALWAALPATASILLLSFTTYLTQDVAAIPFLWILPLSAYLLSFIICFEAPRLYYRVIFMPLLVMALGTAAYMLWTGRDAFGVFANVGLATGALFVFCMVCHGELARLKPHPRYLTAFYLMLAFGGALGGMFVGLAAPVLFNGYFELQLGLALCAALTAIVLIREMRLNDAAWILGAVVIAYTIMLGVTVGETLEGCRVAARNFYGQLRVREFDSGDGLGPRRELLHGAIIHGVQFLEEGYRDKPNSYYCEETGVGKALLEGGGAPRRIGVLGLGTGTIALYGRPGDTIRIYEINPLVVQLARSEFTYLRDSKAQVEIVLGDGRLSLEREPDQRFDVLVMDAFAGDSVPVHLLTEEAFRTYLRHLAIGGVLAVNISNKYLELCPVIERAARRFNKSALYAPFETPGNDRLCYSASWVLVVDQDAHGRLHQPLHAEILQPTPGFRLWTDDYSSLLSVVK
ncbi:MAG: spermidine synthase [Rhodospirillales bacterium]